jgi:carbon storage regulator
VLVMKRSVEEDVIIDGRIVVKILRVDGGTVRLGILAPTDVPIHRGEVWQALVDAFPLGKTHPSQDS